MTKKLLMNEIGGNSESKPYEILEYIEGTGTQYINTNYIPTLNTKIESELLISSSIGSYDYFFGSDKFIRVGMSSNSSTFRVYKYGSEIYNSINPSFLDIKSKFIVDMSDTSKYIRIIINGSKYLNIRFSDSKSTTSTTKPLLIFNAHNDNGSVSSYYAGYGKIYSYKIWESEELVRDFIPSLDMNGVACLYDNITKEYFYNAGTGDFGYEL